MRELSHEFKLALEKELDRMDMDDNVGDQAWLLIKLIIKLLGEWA